MLNMYMMHKDDILKYKRKIKPNYKHNLKYISVLKQKLFTDMNYKSELLSSERLAKWRKQKVTSQLQILKNVSLKNYHKESLSEDNNLSNYNGFKNKLDVI